MKSLNVLLLTQVLPYPPDSGPKVKTWNVLKYLARNHHVTLVSFVRGDQSREVAFLRQYCAAVYTVPMPRGPLLDAQALVRSLLTGQPWMMVRDDVPAMRHLLARLTAEKQFDVVHADQLNMAQYASRVPDARKILDEHNALWLLYERLWQTLGLGPKKLLLGRDWPLLQAYEGEMCRTFDAVLAVSEEDKLALEQAIGGPSDITVIPIAIDMDEVPEVSRQPEANHILHIGTMYWPPNVEGVRWFAEQVYPLIRAACPDVTFDIVGARPPQEIQRLAAAGQGINVTGYVPDPAPYLEQAAVMVVPVRAGGGMRVKILNAFAQGLPVVSTTIGCEGIAVEPGRHLLVADSPEDFAQSTIRLLNDRRAADALGHNGRMLIQSTYDYRAACRPLDRVYAPAGLVEEGPV
jgi:glycosyltransferase involved in cell wall biosynthesis